MRSLMEMVFRALPLVAAWNHARGGQPAKSPQISRLADRVRFVETLDSKDLLQTAPSFDDFKYRVEHGQRVTAKLWGFDARGSATIAKDFTCLVDAPETREYMRMQVFDKVEWGCVPKGKNAEDFSPHVEIVFEGNRMPLSLADANRLLTFKVKSGYTSDGLDLLWPLDLKYDGSFVHVFVFDILRDKTGAANHVVPFKESPDIDDDDVEELLETCRSLNKIGDRLHKAGVMDKRSAEIVLFDDDLWQINPNDDAPYAVVPGATTLGASVARVAVMCCMTLSLWDEDAAPGAATGEASIFPHLMIASTVPLERARGAVRLTRPKTTKMTMAPGTKMDAMDMDGVPTGPKSMMTVMKEMSPNIGSLVVTDSNANAMVIENGLPGPVIAWANLFNYYLDHPHAAFEGKAVHVVRRGVGPRQAQGLVERDCSDITTLPGLRKSNTHLVTKYARQGAFDNIHMSPRMNVNLDIRDVSPANASALSLPVSMSEADKKRLKMKGVAMAPFCVHDCFHMHFRWTDHDAGSQVGICGWGPELPYKQPGAPMVRHNQDVYLFVPTPSSVVYVADAFEVPKDDWQVVCHNGAFYALTVSYKVGLAQDEVYARSGDQFHGPDETENSLGSPPNAAIGDHYRHDWALFYWRLRYRAEESGGNLVAKERFRFLRGWRAAADL